MFVLKLLVYENDYMYLSVFRIRSRNSYNLFLLFERGSFLFEPIKINKTKEG